jgi:hypothetical protein
LSSSLAGYGAFGELLGRFERIVPRMRALNHSKSMVLWPSKVFAILAEFGKIRGPLG